MENSKVFESRVDSPDASGESTVSHGDARDSDIGQKSSPPMFGAIKFGLFLIFLAVGGGVAAFFLGADVGAGRTAHVDDTDDAVEYTLGGASDGSGHVSLDGGPGSQSSSTERELYDRMSDIESALGLLRESVGNVTAPLVGIQERLSSLESQSGDLSGITSRFDTQLESLQQAVDSLRSSVTGISRDVSQLRNRVSDNARALRTRAQRAVDRPPFRLVSIDEWGGEFSAVLEMAGSSTTASLGDRRAGWTITRIDRSGCIFVTRDDSIKAVKVCKEVL